MQQEDALWINRRKPIVTYTLILLNVVMFAATFVLKTFFMSRGQALLLLGAKENTLITLGQYWRLLTAAFLHSGLSHLAFNMFALFFWGRNIEALLGRARYVAVYLLSGICGTLLSYLCSDSLAVGASGAIFGLFGTLLYFRTRHRQVFDQIFGLQVLVIIGINLALGFLGQGIDNFGHIGGLLGGFISAYSTGLNREKPNAKRLLSLLAFSLLLIGGLCFGVIRYSRAIGIAPFTFIPLRELKGILY